MEDQARSAEQMDWKHRLWMFQDDIPSPILRSSFRFGDSDFDIHVIDNFGGLQPLLINQDALTQDEIQIPFRPTALLDSNVVGSLVQFVTKQPPLLPNRHLAVAELLKFFLEKKLDYNPFFYFMEGAWKEQAPDLLKFAEKVSLSVISLHTMDERTFLTTGEVVTDPSRLALYSEEFGKETLEEIAEVHARSMVTPIDPHVEGMNLLSYATLLKMSLIHKTSTKPIGGKYSALRTFMEDTLNIAMGAERMLALGYFAGQFDGFLPLQKGANATRVLRRIHAAAWDLLLLRLPSMLLAHSGPKNGIIVGFICTSDRSLAQIAKAYTLRAVLPSQREGRELPVATYDLSWLHDHIDRDMLEQMQIDDLEWQKQRSDRMNKEEWHVSFDALTELVTELESQVVSVC
jgi:hypothetical protein